MALRRNNPAISLYWTEQDRLLDRHVGKTMSVEELLSLLPDYRDGRRPHGKTAVRRLRHRLDLVSRGPNNSLGRGAVFVVRAPSMDEEALRVFLDAAISAEFSAKAVEEHLERLARQDAKEARKRGRKRRPRDGDSR